MNAKGTLVPPWAWAIFLVAAAWELLLPSLLLAGPSETVEISRESAPESTPIGGILEAA